MKDHVTADEWVAMFREIGLDQAQMQQWHKIFEARHPAAHQAFLEWLRLRPKVIDRARAEFRAES